MVFWYIPANDLEHEIRHIKKVIFNGRKRRVHYKIILLKKAPGQQRLNWHFAPATPTKETQVQILPAQVVVN